MTAEKREQWTSRKFTAMWVFEFIATALVLIDKIDGGQWVMVTGWLVTAYFAANVGQKIKGAG